MKGSHLPLTVLLLCLVTAARAYDITPTSDPETLGFSSSRLARIAAWQQTQVDAGAFSGAVAAIARNGKVAYLRAVGFYDNAKTRPLQSDAIFWIASMSKPVTSVAAMMLVDEGKLDLAAPVSDYLPELKNMKVAVEVKDPATGRIDLAYEPQKRPMTVEDLLRHTAGLIHGVNGTKVDDLYFKTFHDKDGVFQRDRTLADFISALAELPLAHQPGEVWQYGHSVDVLARVVEVASGQRFDQFLEARLLKPLGMADTGFYVPEAKRSRLVDPPAKGPTGPPDSVLADVIKPTRLFSGGGLASTVADYLRFAQMLLNGGELDGVRILKPETVKRMTSNALPPGIRFAGPLKDNVGPRAGTTWGLGFMIRSDPQGSLVPGSVGSFTWSGTWGTYFWIDPSAQLIAMQFIQVPSNTGGPFGRPLRNLVYGALRVPDQGVPAAAPAPLDPAALASVEGTYRFASISSRDLQTEFGGVGVDIAIRDGVLRVTAPIRGTPADRAGVLSGDVITHVNGEPTQGIDLGQAMEKIRGPAHTPVRLRIMRSGQDAPIEIAIVRGVVRAGGGADLQIAVKDGRLQVEDVGAFPVLDLAQGVAADVVPISRDEFFVDGGNHARLAFQHDAVGKVSGLLLNPGPAQITGQRAVGPG